MEVAAIVKSIEEGIDRLGQQDTWLWQNDLSERSLAHRLAVYFEPLFPGYDVDCEYNGDVDTIDGLKRIFILEQQLRQVIGAKKFENDFMENEVIDRLVFPDIIVHRRSTNEHNLCILEIKKNTSKVPAHYDRLKLSTYTSNVNGNTLRYKLGVFILLHMDVPGQYELEFFQNGDIIHI
jgi:predicted AlkP superfamily pyrophosphatase or phosphodiesterase